MKVELVLGYRRGAVEVDGSLSVRDFSAICGTTLELIEDSYSLSLNGRDALSCDGNMSLAECGIVNRETLHIISHLPQPLRVRPESTKDWSFGCQGACERYTVPRDLFTQFRSLAEAATEAGIETLGFLMTRKSAPWIINTLLIPEQVGDSVSCRPTSWQFLTMHEDENIDMRVAGSIHTHPLCGVDLSSKDLHSTHAIVDLNDFQGPPIIAIVEGGQKKRKNQFTKSYKLNAMGLQVIGERIKRNTEHKHCVHNDHLYDFWNVELMHGSIELIDFRI